MIVGRLAGGIWDFSDDNTCRPFSRNDVVAIATTAIKLRTPFSFICAKHNDVILSVALPSTAAAAKFFLLFVLSFSGCEIC